MSNESAEAFLLSLPRFTEVGSAAYQPGLDRIRRILYGMGNPHQQFRSIHVAGTNGKGSTASMLAAIGSALGYRTGLHTSPHLVRITERMRVDGVPAPDEWLADSVDRYRSLIHDAGASFFEATVALSLLYFAERQVEYAVVEVGMGGRLDATNVLVPEVCAVTRIGLEHIEHLGTTLSEIAREKAGIAKRGRPLVLYPAPRDVAAAVEDVCVHAGAQLHPVSGEVSVRDVQVSPANVRFSASSSRGQYLALTVDLGGKHQVENASIALRAAELAWGDHPAFDEGIRNGLATVSSRAGLRGRLEVLKLEPLIVADVAHNSDGLSRALAALEATIASRRARLYVLFSIMADKDVSRLAALLASSATGVFFVTTASPRGLDSAKAVALLEEAGVSEVQTGDLSAGLTWAIEYRARQNDVVLATGSHVLVGNLLRAIEEGKLSLFGTSFA